MEAVTGPQARELKCYSVLQVGRTYLDFLLSKGEFQMAARLCVKILGLYIFVLNCIDTYFFNLLLLLVKKLHTIRTPYDHQSAANEWPLRDTTSGAIYSTVPQKE